jgi:hypothetical protein
MALFSGPRKSPHYRSTSLAVIEVVDKTAVSPNLS